MNTAVTAVLAGIVYGIVCISITGGFYALFGLIEDYFIQKKMEKKSK